MIKRATYLSGDSVFLDACAAATAPTADLAAGEITTVHMDNTRETVGMSQQKEQSVCWHVIVPSCGNW